MGARLTARTALTSALAGGAILLATVIAPPPDAMAQTATSPEVQTSPPALPAETPGGDAVTADPNAPLVRELKVQTERNRSLDERIAMLQKALEGDVCIEPGAMELLIRPPDLQPSAPGRELTPATLGSQPKTDPSPDIQPDTETASLQQPALPDAVTASSEPLGRRQLVANLKQATVLVGTAQGTGSGFFVAPDKVMTNQHVIAPAADGVVTVIGHGTGRPMRARVIAKERGKGPGSADYALLDVPGAAVGAPLALTTSSVQLQEVVAAGYPALLLGTDKAFLALMRGNMTAMPELGFSGGEISAIQPQGQGVSTIAHTANISGGSSGGPLVDRCGRVVGANTFININAKQGQNAGFAISSADIVRFLRQNGVAVSIQQTECDD